MKGEQGLHSNGTVTKSNVLLVNWMPLVGCASYCWRVCDGGYMNVKEWVMCYVIGGSFKEVSTAGVY